MQLRNDHFFLTTAPDMKQIMKPLLSLGITYFSYGRHYNNGGRLWLCNTPHIIKSYYENGHHLIGNSEGHPAKYQPQTVLWSTLPNQRVFEHSRTMSVDHGIFIIEPKGDYCEFLAYGTDPCNYQIVNTYLTHIEYLKNFGKFFQETAPEIISQGEANMIVLPYNNIVLPAINQVTCADIFSKQSGFKLSPRQRAIVPLLLQGKTAKEIAKLLSLSPRTVESYIDNLKAKLKCENKIELIVKLSKVYE